MNLSQAPADYDRSNEAQAREAIRRADQENHKKGRDIEVGAGCRVVMTSPNGNRWALSVSNAGSVVVTAL